MKNYEYIAENISEISRIPIHLYRNGELVSFYFPVPFPVDPIGDHAAHLLSMEQPIGYYITPLHDLLGMVRDGDVTMIVGPCRAIAYTRSELKDLQFQLGVRPEDRSEFENALAQVTRTPLELFIRLLVMVNHYLTGEELTINDIIRYDAFADVSEIRLTEIDETDELVENTITPDEPAHSSYHFEQQMLSYIEHGDPDGLKEFFSGASVGNYGILGETYLRQQKNLMIVSATIASRAAIRGGMPSETGLALCDRYIRHAEKYTDVEQVQNLQYNMIFDFATQVRDLTASKDYSKPVLMTISYIREHFNEPIRVEDLTEYAFLSRSQLSVRFRSETGLTIKDFIMRIKIEKAQEYLRTTDRSILDISTYLGFSSQSHFQKTFREITGETPKTYREHAR